VYERILKKPQDGSDTEVETDVDTDVDEVESVLPTPSRSNTRQSPPDEVIFADFHSVYFLAELL
jgi:hypothetical protein